MLRMVAKLTSRNFQKSMTTRCDVRAWQDVYLAQTPSGVDAYIKLAMPNSDFPRYVVSFKESTSS